MSYNAFVTILLGFNGGQKLHTDTLAEERKILRHHLMEKLHGAELKENGKTPSPKRKTPGPHRLPLCLMITMLVLVVHRLAQKKMCHQ